MGVKIIDIIHTTNKTSPLSSEAAELTKNLFKRVNATNDIDCDIQEFAKICAISESDMCSLLAYISCVKQPVHVMNGLAFFTDKILEMNQTINTLMALVTKDKIE